ncbi:response regulator [Larkinella insperata]|uniref:Response regulator n=1 Tax=Larkinella insperata TaxID=332158 RepID=A0ABW3QF70_9BACT|nr:response regulator transcription factor [Larkinella insperata]
MKTSIVIVVDHHLLAQALSDLIQEFETYEVRYVAENGRDLIRYLGRGTLPDMVLLDISMPDMDGYETAKYLKERHPAIKVLALSMRDRGESSTRSYLPKGNRPADLREALDHLRTKNDRYSEFMTNRIIRSLNGAAKGIPLEYYHFSERERTFLKMACSDMTYAEIADKMCVSARTVDGYREAIFQKMQVKSRVGMAMTAVRWGLVKL